MFLRRLLAVVIAVGILLWMWMPWWVTPPAGAQARPTLYWGSTGPEVREVQSRLAQWGYYNGPISGVFGAQTSEAVRLFQRRNGLAVDGVVGPQTYATLGLQAGPAAAPASTGVALSDEIDLLARVVSAEARGEPYVGRVAVASVIMNRVQNPAFPNTISGVIYQPLAFESVGNGQIWRVPAGDAGRAVRDALNGWDPTYGSIYFWNPYKLVNPWVWSRSIVTQIGRHVFAR
ncbi:MAG: spore cortex-lytic enzyme [Bacillota bacterium]